MAFYKHESVEEPTEPECPVCYECMSGSERTLSCGHVFCHGCLVRTLVSITGDRVITVRDTIICPLCRHLTFIKKQADAVVALLLDAKKEELKQGEQTLKVPIPAPPGAFTHYPGALLQSAARTVPLGLDRRRCFRWMGSLRRYILVFLNLDHNASQIFIISEQGRPTAEEDALREVSTVLMLQQPHVRRRRTSCRPYSIHLHWWLPLCIGFFWLNRV